MLDRDRTQHVADFGIARLGTEDTITGSGQVLGTASYLAPEQALGQPATAASDRYALAVAAFELLVGERPFTAQHFAAQARQHIEQAPPAASSINRALPPSVDRILARGMAKRPDERWPSAQDFARAVESALTEAATRPYRTAAQAAAARPPRQPHPAGRTSDGGGSTRRTASRTGSHPASRTGSNPASRTGSQPPVAYRPQGRRRARIPALAALVAGGIAAVAIAGTMGGGGHPAQSAASVQRQSSAAVHAANATHAAKKPAAAPKPKTTQTTQTVTASPAAATTPPPTADTLEARGHQLMDAGNYTAAIAALKQALQAADPGSLTYAYALFDLGRSLRLAGDPRAAVNVLYQRLQIPNQTGVVRQELQLALEALGQKAGSGGAGTGPSGLGNANGGPFGGPPTPGGPPVAAGPGPQPSAQGNQGNQD